MRADVLHAAEQGLPRQVVLDAVRQQGQRIWQTLTFTDRQRFLRHLRRYWDVCIVVMRIAPQVAEVIGQRQLEGSLKVLATG